MRNSTDISVLLDRSGSMETIAADTVGSWNRFLSDQQALDGECSLSLVQFSTDVFHEFTARPIRHVSPLTMMDFVPSGGTALLDAIGQVVTETGYRLAALPERQRPDKVLFVIITDGQENSSHHWSKDRIFDLINQQRTQYNWQFIFLAANQDAIKVGAGYGFAPTNTMTIGADAAGTAGSYGAMSMHTSALRSTGVMPAFSDADRVSAAGTTGPAWDAKAGIYARA